MFSEAPVVLRVPCFAPELYVRADIERKPAEKKKIRTTTSARHACVSGRTCVHVVVRAAAVAALCHVRPYVPRRRCLRTYVRTFVSACERTCV